MKYIFIGIVILGVVMGIVLYMGKSKTGPASIHDDNDNKILALDTSLLTVINNNVQAKDVSEIEYKDVQESVKVSDGSSVKTSSTGRAIIEADDKSTTVLDKNSEIIVSIGPDQNQTGIKLESGNLWARVKKVFNSGEFYKVETPNAVATVRGTSFGIFYGADGKTTLLVTENKVSLLSLDPKTKQPVGEEVVINENQKGIVTTGEKPKVEQMTDSDKSSEWYQYNQKESVTATPEIKPTSSATLKPTFTPTLTSITTPTQTPTPIPTSTATPTPVPKPTLNSITPKTVNKAYGSRDFFINGKNLNGSKQVLLGDVAIRSYVLDPQTIIGTVTDEVQPGIYDVSVVVSTGETLILPQALTVK